MRTNDDSIPILGGRKKAEIVPPHCFETSDGKTWAAAQAVTLGFMDTEGNFVTINQVIGTIVDEVTRRMSAILAPIQSDGGTQN